jgi:hypothetical protein
MIIKKKNMRGRLLLALNGKGSLTMGYLDNFDNEFSNKYEKNL